MSDYKVGKGKPPQSTQFRPGKSGNPKGRPPKKAAQFEELASKVLDARMKYRENGKPKIGTRREVSLKALVEKAAKGNIGAAELILKKREHAVRHGGNEALRLVVTDWLPDHHGQTGAQKLQNLAAPAEGQTEDQEEAPVDPQQGVEWRGRASQDEGA